mmetsp:Transcript_5555/g.12158  ORF Transcript_5555/g.12158 Transcript_5555/m.12158 type:complete len:235 (+) Transcript_5555:1189-1893(+)
MHQKGSADIHVEILEPAVSLAQVRVPQPHHARQSKLPQQEAIHPLKCKLQKLDAGVFEMSCQISIDAVNELLQVHDHALHPRLIRRVMILNPRQKIREAPISVGLDLLQHLVRNVPHDLPVKAVPPHEVTAQEHRHEGRRQIVYTLHVAARGVSHRPYVKQPAQAPSHPVVVEQRHLRHRAGYVHQHLPQCFLLGTRAGGVGYVVVLLDRVLVLPPTSAKGGLVTGGVRGDVPQ